MDLFDAIYIINLRSRTDRRAEMIEQLGKVGIDPGSPQVVFFDGVRPDDAAGFPTLGARGCFLSHLGVLKSALAAGHGRILVLEDDLNFAKDFAHRFEQVVPTLSGDDWALAYLGALHVEPPAPAGGPIRNIAPSNSVQGLHMLALSAKTIAPLIAYFEAILARPPGDPAGGPMHVDGAYSWFRLAHPAMRTVLCVPPLGYQRSSRTDIHATRWFDRAPLVRDVVAAMRRIKARA